MKSFSIGKLTTGVLITLMAVSLVGCSTTSTKSVSSSEIPAVTQPAKEASEVSGDGSILATQKTDETVQETASEESAIVESVVDASAVEEKETVSEVAPTVKEQVPANEVVAPVVEEKISYPLGIEPIVKSDADYPVFDLFIVHTSDVNGTFESSANSIGYARLSTMMQVSKSITNNILLVDAGNALSGSLVADETQGVTSGNLLYMLDYDAFVPQINDYAFGDSALLDAAKLAKDNSSVKVLSANTLDSENYLPLQPYQLYDFNGFKVCVVGLTGPFTQEGIDFTFDSKVVLQNAQYALDMASQYADYIVVVGSTTSISSDYICSNLNGIDLFIDGSNSSVESGTVINGATIVSTKANMAEVGVVDVVVKNGEVSSVNPLTITADDVNNPSDSKLASANGIVNIPEDSTVASYIDSQVEKVDALISKPVSVLPSALSVNYSQTTKSKLAKFFVDNLTDSNKVDFSIVSGGVFANSLNAGEVSIKDVNAAIANNVNVCITEMTGAQIYGALEVGYSLLPEENSYFTQSDLGVIYNKYAKPGKRVLRVKLGSKYIDKAATYTVATDSVLCDPESGFDMGTVVSKGKTLNAALYDMLVSMYPVK